MLAIPPKLTQPQIDNLAKLYISKSDEAAKAFSEKLGSHFQAVSKRAEYLRWAKTDRTLDEGKDRI